MATHHRDTFFIPPCQTHTSIASTHPMVQHGGLRDILVSRESHSKMWHLRMVVGSSQGRIEAHLLHEYHVWAVRR